jgi:hypothetical protein
MLASVTVRRRPVSVAVPAMRSVTASSVKDSSDPLSSKAAS